MEKIMIIKYNNAKLSKLIKLGFTFNEAFQIMVTLAAEAKRLKIKHN
jgi:hypothetical protein